MLSPIFKVGAPATVEIIVTKEEALEAYNGNATKLAADLKRHPSNISLWADGEPIPERHALRLVFILKREFFKDKVPPALKRTKRDKAGPVAPAGSPKRTGEDGSLAE